MREFKFRAWDGKKMWQPDYLTHDGFAAEYENYDDPRVYPKQPVMQYTGLKDFRGVEIYEGDILLASDSILRNREIVEVNAVLVCKYTNEFTRFSMVDELGSHYRLYDYDRFKVIGNIYENPELLEQQA